MTALNRVFLPACREEDQRERRSHCADCVLILNHRLNCSEVAQQDSNTLALVSDSAIAACSGSHGFSAAKPAYRLSLNFGLAAQEMATQRQISARTDTNYPLP